MDRDPEVGPAELDPGLGAQTAHALQQRLGALGLGPDSTGAVDDDTAREVAAFQVERGLVATGECDPATWAALVEAGYRLGDRLLYLTRPMQRGDDVADLQRRLGGMGFDAGHIDGIFGPDTDRALRDFQHNSGITRDGVCGPATLGHLARIGNRISQPAAIAGVRARQQLRDAPRSLDGWRVVVAHRGGADVVARAMVRHIGDAGGAAMVVQHHDPSAIASQANDYAAGALIDLQVGDGPSWCAYYRSGDFESPGGRRLAELLTADLTIAGITSDPPRGMRLATLRESRMPAVVVHLAPAPLVVTEAATIATVCSNSLRNWVEAPLEPEE